MDNSNVEGASVGPIRDSRQAEEHHIEVIATYGKKIQYLEIVDPRELTFYLFNKDRSVIFMRRSGIMHLASKFLIFIAQALGQNDFSRVASLIYDVTDIWIHGTRVKKHEGVWTSAGFKSILTFKTATINYPLDDFHDDYQRYARDATILYFARALRHQKDNPANPQLTPEELYQCYAEEMQKSALCCASPEEFFEGLNAMKITPNRVEIDGQKKDVYTDYLFDNRLLYS